MYDKLEEKLSSYIAEIENNTSYKTDTSNGAFPLKKTLNDEPLSHLKFIVKQAKNLLQDKSPSPLGGVNYWEKDKELMLRLFINDLELYSTDNNVQLGDGFIASYGRTMISDHAFFHIARSSLFPESYQTIDLLEDNKNYGIYSIPFKIRVALENKLKKIIGFESCDVKRNGQVKKRANDIPFGMVINH